MPNWKIASRHGLVVSLVLVISSPRLATADEGLCSNIAQEIRAGKVDHTDWFDDPIIPDGALQDLGKPEQDVAGTLRRLHARPDLLSAADRFWKTGSHNPSEIVWMDNSGAGAIVDPGGHNACTRFLFFKSQGGSAHVISSPDGIAVDRFSGCLGTAPRLASIAGVPVFVVYPDNYRDFQTTREEVRIIPWLHDHWGHGCRIDATFSPRNDRTRGAIESVSILPQ